MKDLLKAVILVALGGILGFVAASQGVRANQPPTFTDLQPYQQRFVQIQQPKDMIGVPLGLMALDTKSGVMCRTYDSEFWKTLIPLCSLLP